MITKDPVCGMVVDADHALIKAQFLGETYYFCSQGCLGQFQRKPQQFVVKQAETGSHAHRHT